MNRMRLGIAWIVALALPALPALLGGCVSGVPGDCGECVRAVKCVEKCGGEVVQSGCCPCPDGTFDDFECNAGSGGGGGTGGGK